MANHDYKIGDKVKVLDATRIMGGAAHFRNGDITEIMGFSPVGSPKLKTGETRTQGLAILDAELQYIELYDPEAPVVGPEGTSLDNPIRPEHYHHGGIDVFAYGEANFSKEAVAGFYRMNIIKYVTRYDKKNGMQDLEKTEYYLKALLRLEGKQEV